MPSKVARRSHPSSLQKPAFPALLKRLAILSGSRCPERGMRRVMLSVGCSLTCLCPLQCCSLPGNNPLQLCASVVLRSWCA